MNKKALLFFSLVLCSFHFLFANPEKQTLKFGEYDREYLLFTPQNAEKPRGIIVCLHGFNSSMNVFFNSYDISGIADQMNYIILAPQALNEKSADVVATAQLLGAFGFEVRLDAAWGCGTKVSTTFLGQPVELELNKTIDDVGFIKELIRITSEANELQTNDVFVLGTSLGGFMAYQLALSYGNELKGIISIAGSMGLAIKDQNNKVQVPICDFHSITDEVVPYEGSMKITEGFLSATVQLAWKATDVIDFWVKKNGITSSPVVENIDYFPSTNGITVEKLTYADAVNEVVHYKTNGAPHDYFFRKENGDCMDMREEIVHFIQAHASDDQTGLEAPAFARRIFYPNPVQDKIYFDHKEGLLSVFSLDGRTVLSGSFASGEYNLSGLKKGTYIIRIQKGNQIQTSKLIKQ